MTKQLSPAAEAVLNAAVDAYGINYSEFHCCADRVTAAALRAAADQLGQDLEFYNTRMVATRDLLAIADELEAQ